MSRKKTFKFRLLNNNLTIILLSLLLTTYSKTVRVRFEGLDRILDHISSSGPVVLCSWHQRFFAGFYLPRILKRPIAIMISQSSDGDFISAVVERIGWIPVRGSSSRGGKKALRELIDLANRHGICGHIVDGPTGPPRRIKPGLISLAHQARAAICLVYVHYDNPWVFNSWDRFMVPRPGSGALIRFGPPQQVPDDMDDGTFEALRRRVEETMIREYESREGSLA
ncbi:MAG: lysophospholipid acyltransferase family protein [Syntrophales bacterium]|jgi:lysophospholipid acyltransferase (LPLAT)-like uncharacterized protein|nr:lysophospholipid acyltransferase family protein [Syntrophales bacterium]MCK9527107.1 lysophospholipid acyltransferase family protein [Syntrophales bacterium]MDX9921768.1 lysophospholipid acyltransferase family protein [Syntrophales bacterium]